MSAGVNNADIAPVVVRLHSDSFYNHHRYIQLCSLALFFSLTINLLVKGFCPCVSPPQPNKFILLGQIGISFIAVNTDDDHGLLLADLHVLVHEVNEILTDLSAQYFPFMFYYSKSLT